MLTVPWSSAHNPSTAIRTRDTRSTIRAGAVVCILAGTAITIFWNLQQLALQHGKGTLLPPEWLARDAIFPALLVSVVSLVVVSLLTRAPAPEKWAPFAAAGS